MYRSMVRDFIGLFFPNYCVACQVILIRAEAWICTGCWAQLPQTNYHLTAIDNPLIEKFYGRVPLQYAMALYSFRGGGRVQRIVHQLKYGDKPTLGQYMGRLYGIELATVCWLHPFDCIVPVPLHPDRLRQRGYNQSQCVADGLAAGLGLSCVSGCIQRIKNTRSQTGITKLDRLKQLEDAFCVVAPHLVAERHILVVDDVVTTGATLEACALALLTAGAKTISLATLAVTE